MSIPCWLSPSLSLPLLLRYSLCFLLRGACYWANTTLNIFFTVQLMVLKCKLVAQFGAISLFITVRSFELKCYGKLSVSQSSQSFHIVNNVNRILNIFQSILIISKTFMHIIYLESFFLGNWFIFLIK